MHSLRSATCPEPPISIDILFQSTHSLRSATDETDPLCWGCCVSIHALLAECDITHMLLRGENNSFNPRTPCGVRPLLNAAGATLEPFQSTHSLRSATPTPARLTAATVVSIHALLAECDIIATHALNDVKVSIHALLAECDPGPIFKALVCCCFNPRTPCGVRPSRSSLPGARIPFQSTHSLRSATLLRLPRGTRARCFNPRTPCGVRLTWTLPWQHGRKFQSTHSLRSATKTATAIIEACKVSIHALLAECDYAYPHHARPRLVSIHALLAECDRCFPCLRGVHGGFNPRTPCGVRQVRPRGNPGPDPGFNPRTPCGVRQRLTIYIVIQQRKRYFAPTSRRRPSSPSLLF